MVASDHLLANLAALRKADMLLLRVVHFPARVAPFLSTAAFVPLSAHGAVTCGVAFSAHKHLLRLVLLQRALRFESLIAMVANPRKGRATVVLETLTCNKSETVLAKFVAILQAVRLDADMVVSHSEAFGRCIFA